MEQLLNLAWLLAVAGIITAVAARPRRSRSARLLVAGVVFVCIAALLFPVISATDDLHFSSDLSDDTARRHAKHIVHVAVLGLIAVLLVVAVPTREFRLLALCGASCSTDPGHLRLDAGRAPPPIF